MWNRVVRGVGANVVNQLAIALVQIVSVPVLTSSWGLELYGWWILASAIPSYMALSDLGFATAAGNEMTMSIARGDPASAERQFQSSWALVTTVSTSLLLALAVGLEFGPSALLNSKAVGPEQTKLVVLVLAAQSVGILQSGLLLAGFRASGRYALGTSLQGAINFFEGVSTIAVAGIGGDPLAAAAVLLAIRMAGVCLQRLCLSSVQPLFHWSTRKATLTEIKKLAHPAFAALSLPIAQAGFLQGTNIAIGAASSTTNVAIFSAVRTLVRIGVQGVTLLNHALMPEFSAASAQNDRQRQLTLAALSFGWSLLVLAPVAALLAFMGVEIVSLWSRDTILPSKELIITMSFVMLLNGLWHPTSNLLLAINKHSSFAYPYALLAVGSVALTYATVRSCGLIGAAISLMCLDALMFILVGTLFVRFIGTPSEAFSSLVALIRSAFYRVPGFRGRHLKS